jgi:hypothetical protein
MTADITDNGCQLTGCDDHAVKERLHGRALHATWDPEEAATASTKARAVASYGEIHMHPGFTYGTD